MSYALKVWRVDIEKLKSYHGAKDQRRLAELLADPDIAAAIAVDAKESADKIATGMPSLKDALRSIIFGKTSHTDPADPWGRHVRVLELLIEACGGTCLNNDQVSRVVPQEDIMLLEDIIHIRRSRPPFPIPTDGKIVAGHLTAAAVVAKLDEIKEMDELDRVEIAMALELDELNDLDRLMTLVQFEDWLTKAKDAGQGLVTVAR